MSERPAVTCHVLDTTTGKPAANVTCAIYKIDLSNETLAGNYQVFEETDSPKPFAMSRTNEDGRVPSWIFEPSPSKREMLKALGIEQDIETSNLRWGKLVPGTYKIRFQVGKYYRSMGQTNFHPFVDIVFQVEDSRHYHIPLLLSNYGYSTYRGS